MHRSIILALVFAAATPAQVGLQDLPGVANARANLQYLHSPPCLQVYVSK